MPYKASQMRWMQFKELGITAHHNGTIEFWLLGIRTGDTFAHVAILEVLDTTDMTQPYDDNH